MYRGANMWDAVLDSGPNAAKYASSVFNILSWALFGDRQCRYCSHPIPIDQSLFEHISQVHLSMKPSSIINSLKDLSDLEIFATTIEFLFDVGHKFLSLTRSKLYLKPSHCWTQNMVMQLKMWMGCRVEVQGNVTWMNGAKRSMQGGG